MVGTCRATSLAEQLELFVQMAAAPPSLKDRMSSEKFRTVECTTDLSFEKLDEWQAAETELLEDGVTDATLDATTKRCEEIREEEKLLDEELDMLRGQLKQEKAFNHQENQTHQQKMKKLQQTLQKLKKEDASRKKAFESKVGKAKEKMQEEKDDLTAKLEQARDLNKCLKQKLEAPGIAELQEDTKRLKSELHTLNLALADEVNKSNLLREEFEATSGIMGKRQSEIDEATRRLDSHKLELDKLRAAATQRAERIEAATVKRDELLKRKDDVKEVVRALRVKHRVAQTKYEDLMGIPRTVATFRRISRSSSKQSSKGNGDKSEEQSL